MMRLAIALTLLAAAPVPALKPDAAVEGEMALPPVALGASAVKIDAKLLSLAAKYADGPGDETLRKEVREAQVLLWASSPETPPAHLRAAVAKARAKHGVPFGLLKTQFVAPKTVPQTAAFKAALLATNRELARLVAALEQQLEDLQQSAEARDKECPRWQAHHDLVTASLLFRLAHLDEFAIQIGEMRKEFPERDPVKHKGWRLEPIEGVRDALCKKRVKAGRKLFRQLVTDHDGTPWAAAARQVMDVPLSVQWKAE